MVVSCTKQETSTKTVEDSNEYQIQDAKEAYVYAKNLAEWNSVLNNSKRYKEVVGKEIDHTQQLEVYKEKNIDRDSEDENYYFVDEDFIDVGSCLSYSITKKAWSTMFGLVYKADFDELLSKGKLEFVGEVNLSYPTIYFPKAKLTNYKKRCLKEINSYIKMYMEKYLKKGKYRIVIMDFSDADNYTLFMVQNDKGKNSVLPLNITEDINLGIHIESQTNLITPDFKDDYDLGGIKYSELFSKLSVDSYTLKI